MTLKTNLSHVLPFAALLTSAAAIPIAHAQAASIYATVNFTHVSNVETGSVLTGSTFTEQFASNTPVGIGGGVTFNILPLPVIKLGIDLRGSTRPGTVGADTALGGIKLTVTPPLLKPKIFVEGAVGYLGTRTVNVSSTTGSTGAATTIGGTFGNQYAIYQIIGGVDYPLIHFVDYRIEVAGGRSFGNGTIFNTGQNANASLFTVNTGVVLHF